MAADSGVNPGQQAALQDKQCADRAQDQRLEGSHSSLCAIPRWCPVLFVFVRTRLSQLSLGKEREAAGTLGIGVPAWENGPRRRELHRSWPPSGAEFSPRLLPHLLEVPPLFEERDLIRVPPTKLSAAKKHCGRGSANVQVQGRVQVWGSTVSSPGPAPWRRGKPGCTR